MTDTDFIPKIDLSNVLTYGITSPQSFETLKEIKKASEEVGFFTVINHGITKNSIKKIFLIVKFFSIFFSPIHIRGTNLYCKANFIFLLTKESRSLKYLNLSA